MTIEVLMDINPLKEFWNQQSSEMKKRFSLFIVPILENIGRLSNPHFQSGVELLVRQRASVGPHYIEPPQWIEIYRSKSVEGVIAFLKSLKETK